MSLNRAEDVPGILSIAIFCPNVPPTALDFSHRVQIAFAKLVKTLHHGPCCFGKR